MRPPARDRPIGTKFGTQLMLALTRLCKWSLVCCRLKIGCVQSTVGYFDKVANLTFLVVSVLFGTGVGILLTVAAGLEKKHFLMGSPVLIEFLLCNATWTLLHPVEQFQLLEVSSG